MIACDTGGWFPLKEIVDQRATMEAVINIVDHDDRGRFQISAEVDKWGNIYDYFAIRAVSGHGIPWLDPFRLGCWLTEADLDAFGCITHVTQKDALIGIFRMGLLPGGTSRDNVRSETDFGCYFCDDPRREIGGRVGQDGYNVTIVMNKQILASSCQLFLAPNGVIFTRDAVSPLAFFSIIEHM